MNKPIPLGKAALRCTCGSDKFSYPAKPNLEATDVVTCDRCKRQATVAVLLKQAGEAAKKALADALRKGLK